MSDNVVRHLIALLGTLVIVCVYIAGYVSAGHGWWWTVFASLVFYYIIYKLVDA